MSSVDYKNIISSVNRIIRETLDEIVIKEQSSIDSQMKYPFSTFTILNPYLNTKTYRESDIYLKQSVEITVSYTFYSTDMFEAMSLAQKAMTSLEQRGNRQTLWEKYITIVDMTNVTNRDTFITIQTERRFGFDLRLRINNISNKEINDIITIELNDGSEIHK